MKNKFLFFTLMLLIGTQVAVDAQDLSVSDVQDSGCQRGTRSRANENETKRTIVLTKEGTILTVQILGFVSNCATMGFDITPNMSGGSDGEPVSVSLGVEPILPDVVTTCECPFNVSFTLHGLETNSFYFTCWWYEGQVNLTEGEPLTLESITEPVQIDDWYCIIDKVNHTAIVEGIDGGTSELLIPWVLSYEGEEYYVTGIGEHAFINYKALTSVTLPTNLTHISDFAFAGCSNLKDVYCFADQVPTTESDVFKETPIASATLHVTAGMVDKYKATSPWSEFGNIVALPAVANEYIDPQTNVVYTYEPGQGIASVKAGYEEAQSTGFGEGEVFFYSGSPDAEGDIVILDRFSVGTEEYVVTRIGEGAFRENSKIKSVSIPETVTDIGKLAFCWCDSLTSVQLPSGLTKIAPWLFCCCNQLMSVTIPSSVSTIGERAFADCGSLANITLPESLTSIGYGVFSNCYFVADSFINKSTLTSSNKWGATLCDMETSEGLMLKDNSVVFCRPWTWINSVTIPNGVTSIEKNAFMDRSGLTSVTIPYSVTSIGEDAFLRCFGLSSVTIPSSVTKIGNSAFCLCYGLTSVTIGSGMASIGAGAFYECRNLRNVCCYAEDVPDTGINTFEGLPIASATLHVPAGSVDSYKAVSPWNEFGNIVEMATSGKILPFVQDGKVWTYEASNFIYECEETNSLEGDTVISSRKCLKLYYSCQHFNQNHLYKGAMFEEGEKVYIIVPGSTTPVLLYDFSYEPGTIFKVGEFEIKIKETKLVKYRGEYLRVFDYCLTDYEEYPFGGIEGLGFLGGGLTCLIDGYTPANTGGERYLKTCSINGEVVFDLQDFYTSAQIVTKDEVTFTKDQMATIILPTAPDASKGKYYRLDRVENGQIVFEQEKQPRARVPYIIVPSEGFSIDISSLDLESLQADTVTVGGVSFIGSYVRKELPALTGGDGGGSLYYDIIDTTPDCGFLSTAETGKEAFRIGALRAYLTVNWDDPYNHHGSKSPEDKLDIVLKDDGTGIEQIQSSKFKIQNDGEEVNGKWSNGKCYDLSGRKWSMINGQFSMPKGIYIQNSRKLVK